MGRRFQELAFSRLVKEHQQEHGSRRQYERMEQSGPPGNTLGPTEQDFIQRRDSFLSAKPAGPTSSIAAAPKASFASSTRNSSASQTCAATSSTSAWEIRTTTPVHPSSYRTPPTSPASRSSAASRSTSTTRKPQPSSNPSAPPASPTSSRESSSSTSRPSTGTAPSTSRLATPSRSCRRF